MEEIKDDQIEQESSPVQDEEVDSSATEEEQLEEEVTSQEEPADKEPPFHEHPRWQELQAEKSELKEENRRLQQQMFEAINKSNQPNKEVIEEQIVEASTPEEKKFWQNVHKVAQVEAKKARAEAAKEYRQEIAGYQKMVGGIIADRFIEKNSDIVKGSPEMQAITKEAQELSAMGMPIQAALEKAKKIVMFDKAGQKAVEKEKQKKQIKTKQKEAANIETKSIPEGNLAPAQSVGDEITFDDLDQAAKDIGYTF